MRHKMCKGESQLTAVWETAVAEASHAESEHQEGIETKAAAQEQRHLTGCS